MTKQDVARINELARLQRERELTPEEKDEQASLRKQYLEDFRQNLRQTLDNVYVERESGAYQKVGQKGGHDMLMLKNDALSVTVCAHGAEIQSIRDKNNVERLWQGDPAWWTGRAPVLFPFAGGLKDDYYIYRGQKYQVGKHGFAKLSDFRVTAETPVSLTLRLAQQPPCYPFAYNFDVRFELRDNTLCVSYITTNTGAEPMYYSVGAHEAYACPEGVEHYELVFDQEESLVHSELEGSQITRSTRELTHNSRVLKLHPDLFVPDALVLQNVKSRAVTLRSALHDRTVRVCFPGHDTLMVWQKRGAPYVCIEPWCNPPEYTDSDHELTHKPGIICLESGQSDTRTHTITFG